MEKEKWQSKQSGGIKREHIDDRNTSVNDILGFFSKTQ